MLVRDERDSDQQLKASIAFEQQLSRTTADLNMTQENV
jgi:hypothetical protein